MSDSYTKFNNFKEGKDEDSSFLNIIKVDLDVDSAKDSLIKEDSNIQKKESNFVGFFGEEIEVKRMMDFQLKNPEFTINRALDSLHIGKSFSNKFWYSRTELINSITRGRGASKQLSKQLISYLSLALLVVLPLFTLFLFVVYFRKGFAYVEHLIFVFHTQTAFFLLATVCYIMGFLTVINFFVVLFFVFFEIYFYLAMKRFYNQSYLKTFFKFIIANSFLLFLGLITMVFLSAISFALY